MSKPPSATSKPDFVAWGYSDDCAGITGPKDLMEYDFPGEWFELVVDGAKIGWCRMVYSRRAWDFEVKLDEGHTMKARTPEGFQPRSAREET